MARKSREEIKKEQAVYIKKYGRLDHNYYRGKKFWDVEYKETPEEEHKRWLRDIGG